MTVTQWTPPPSFLNANENTTLTEEHVHVLRRVCLQICELMSRSNHLYSAHTCTCTGAQDTCLVHATLTAKNAHTPTQACLCESATTSLPGVETIATHLENWVLPKRPSKSTTAHDVDVAASLRRHHLIIHVGAGPIQLAYGLPSLFATIAINHRFPFVCIFWPEHY